MNENAAVGSRTEPAIRNLARGILSGIPPQVSSKHNPAQFSALTGLTQDYLEREWARGSAVTSCNSFTGAYARRLGSHIVLGTFWPETTLARAGKAHAWVPAGSGRNPGYGDIFIVQRHNPDKPCDVLHAGVVLQCQGAIWSTIEGGQGGPGLGYDLVLRKSGVFDRYAIKGWVDIDALFHGARAAEETGARAMPTWLTGWWQVVWQGRSYFYQFDGGTGVRYSKAGVGGPINGVGQVRVEGDYRFTIHWPASGTVERFELDSAGRMRGRLNNTEPLYAAFIHR